MNGQDILAVARPHIGEKYVLGAVVAYDNSNCRGPWDCAEFATWCTFQAYKFLYGCASSGEPGSAYTGTWRQDANQRGRRIGVAEATQIPGAFLLRYPAGSQGIGHIVIAAGDGSTVEAADTSRGVIAGTVAGRRWDTGVLLPGVAYAQGASVLPPVLRAEPLPNPDPRVVEIQLALKEQGFDPGPIDGLFGEQTRDAVTSFQAANGLIVDGEVGPQTKDVLFAHRPGAAPAVGAPPAAAPVPPGAAPASPGTSTKYADLKDEFLALFAALVPSTAKAGEIALATKRVLRGKARYQVVASSLGAIPWYVIGVINELESTSDFDTHLHNGDSLARRTHNVPAGRPPTGSPPFTWEESAEDALRMKDYDSETVWDLSHILFRLERYNGLGSRRHGIFTPYLWSGCQHYKKGKYVADGRWDPNAVSKQIGCGVILKDLQSRGEIVLQMT